MKTLLFASALLLAAADADGSTGGEAQASGDMIAEGSPAGTPEPQSETIAPIPETTAPEAEPATGGGAAPDPNVNDQVESDEAFEARQKERRAAREKLRAETPSQVLELKAQAGTSHLGIIIQGEDGETRVHPLSDWRTDLVVLKPGDTATVVVLVGEDLETYLSFAKREQAMKDAPVKTVSLEPAAAAAVLGAAAAPATV